jgi:hypothetical protein
MFLDDLKLALVQFTVGFLYQTQYFSPPFTRHIELYSDIIERDNFSQSYKRGDNIILLSSSLF